MDKIQELETEEVAKRISEILQEKGTDFLRNEDLFEAAINDELNDLELERKTLVSATKEHIGKTLLAAQDLSKDEKRKAVNRVKDNLINDASFSNERANFVIDVFTTALKWPKEVILQALASSPQSRADGSSSADADRGAAAKRPKSSSARGPQSKKGARNAKKSNQRLLWTLAVAVVLVLALILFFVFGPVGKSGSNKVLATVAGAQITQEQVDGLAALVAILNSSTLNDLDATQKEQLRNSVLVFYIDIECMKAHYKTAGTEIISADQETTLKEQSATMLEQMAASYSAATLKQQHVTEDLLYYYLSSEFYDNQYRADVLAADPVTEDEISAYYTENAANYTRLVNSVESSHILMGDENHTDEDRAAIEAVRERVLAGEDFATLAAEFSLDGSASNGGSIGYYDENGSLVQPYLDAMNALAVGEVSEVVESIYGFHIIKVTDIKNPGPMELSEVSDSIKSDLEYQRMTVQYPKLRDSYEIEWNKSLNIDPTTNLPLPAETEAAE